MTPRKTQKLKTPQWLGRCTPDRNRSSRLRLRSPVGAAPAAGDAPRGEPGRSDSAGIGQTAF